ncbi:MAG: CsgG/HfaB family protein [Gammaproteobacteria bacterium]
MTKDGAVTDALVNAINHVNGRVINQQTLALSLRAGFRTNQHAHGAVSTRTSTAAAKATLSSVAHVAADAYGRFIDEETHGAVKSYSILSLRQNLKGVWTAKVRSSIAKFDRPKEAMRRSIAVFPVTAVSRYFPIGGHQKNGEHIATLLGQSLTNSLTAMGNFTVLDREHDSSLNKELAAIPAGQASIDDYALLGKRLVADYVLVTQLNQFQFKTKVTHFMGTSRVIRTEFAEIDTSYRLIDPVTSQVVESGTLHKVIPEKTLHSYGALSSPKDKEETLAAYTGEAIARSIGDALYPVMIVDASGDNVVIAEGDSALRTGESYRIFRYGKTVYDPYTSENLGREEYYCCNVTISRVTPTLAYGKISHFKGAFQDIFKPETYILREQIQKNREANEKANSNKLKRMIKKQNNVFGGGDRLKPDTI